MIDREGVFSITISKLFDLNDPLYVASNVKSPVQETPVDCFAIGCDWKYTHKIVVKPEWGTGPYYVEISSNDNFFYIPFVVKAVTGKFAKNLVIVNTNTWQAYNTFGGASFYRYKARADTRWGKNKYLKKGSSCAGYQRPDIHISMEVKLALEYIKKAKSVEQVASGMMPLDISVGRVSHRFLSESYAWLWLRASGYDYDLITDQDLHNDAIPLEYNNVVLVSHPEYWSLEMYSHFCDFIDNGGNLISLAGNVIYRRVNMRRRRKMWSNRMYKSTDAIPGNDITYIWTPPDMEMTLNSPLSPLVNTYPGQVIGSAFITKSVNTYAPYKVIQDDHWVLEGVKLEKDRLLGSNNLSGEGASGHEMDASVIGQDHVIASGQNQGGGADIIYHEIGEARVFSVG
jgi:N,N-dimethylformamidase